MLQHVTNVINIVTPAKKANILKLVFTEHFMGAELFKKGEHISECSII